MSNFGQVPSRENLDKEVINGLPLFMEHYRNHAAPNKLDSNCNFCQYIIKVRGGQ